MLGGGSLSIRAEGARFSDRCWAVACPIIEREHGLGLFVDSIASSFSGRDRSSLVRFGVGSRMSSLDEALEALVLTAFCAASLPLNRDPRGPWQATNSATQPLRLQVRGKSALPRIARVALRHIRW